MTANELRKKYLEFFAEKGHKVLPSAPLAPENDPTVLFTTAGMHPLVPYLLGEKHPLGNRLVNSQKCLRTEDIDEVGDNRHLTFFEMLGNWSLGDYFKKEAIEMSFEFLTKELKIPLEKLAFTVFVGDSDAAKDEESAEIWKNLGVSEKRIAYLGKNDNWWGPAGQTGPCGPDTEMFYWTGPPNDEGEAPEIFDPKNEQWVEIWNNVFMQFNKKADGKFEQSKQKNVDTGMGLERVAAVLQGKDNVFETELFQPIIQNIKIQTTKSKQNPNNKISNEEKIKAERVIADHIKAATFLLAEKIAPSNIGRGYVLRRLIRRTIRYGKLLGMEKDFCSGLAKTVIEIYQDTYPEAAENQNFIFNELQKEEKKFFDCLDRGLAKFEEITKEKTSLSGIETFDLFQTYGFPFEMTKELAKEKNISVNKQDFQKELKKHQKLSRTAAAGQFKSGLADNSEQTTKYHTATHLMLASLKQILGGEIEQRGSSITAERLRFDFSFPRKITPEELQKVENLVNQKIQEGLCVVCEEMTPKEAKAKGATGVFGHKYGEKVKVFTVCQVPDLENHFSKEICSGPHVKSTQELGKFKIIKEESASSGVRRIKAILG